VKRRAASALLGILTVALAAPGDALAHGDRIPESQLTGAWEAQPVVLVAAAVTLLLFAQAFVRLRRRGRADHAPTTRAVIFAGGVAVATLALVSPLDPAGEEYLLSAHMLQHVVLADLAPALVVVALRGPLTFFLLPPPLLGRLAALARLRAALAFLLRPRVSFALWALVIGAWHVPAAYEYVLTRQWAHDLEHATFVIAGLLVWTQLVDPAHRRTLRLPGRIAFAVVLFACGQALADVLVFSFDPLYGSYAAQDERLLGLSPLTDQRLAGVVMMVEQLVTLGTCVALLLLAYHRGREAGERPTGRSGSRSADALGARS
jgi:putative membrane protein